MANLIAAKQGTTGFFLEALKHFEEGLKALSGGDINGVITICNLPSISQLQIEE